ncbi:hypothetical protein [Paraglaciecola sp. MB-3u-78]|uniref:hypothetical protein n=1 Tax=Paraglaciecola sp. MB-3u-78 TaxID=2058332 RepID=UPI000C34D7A1|nr:hypothetical protein [Paraglaciecola sp. MB-3u-78]PKH00883.1 hypothetical protein CXF95_01320 [Paraglaciecola sp. MB-3u-78]
MKDEVLSQYDNYDDENECFVLFEASNELIVLHRNMRKQAECIVMTQSLMDKVYPCKKHWCLMVEYHYILPHRAKIKKYLVEQENMKLFNAFFKMSIEEFFEMIAQPALKCV